MKNKKAIVPESQVLKALNDLESFIAKGDALAEADTEGEFSTEGTPLSNQAPSGKSDTVKSVSKSKKAMPPSMNEASSDDDGSMDAASSMSEDDEDGEDTSKSFGENPTIRKAIEVSDFIEALVDANSQAYGSVNKSLATLAKSLTDALASKQAVEESFQIKMAKGLVQLGRMVDTLTSQVTALTQQPNVPQRKAVLSKSEVQQPVFNNGGNGGGAEGDLSNVSRSAIEDWLFQKALTGKIDPMTVTVFEQNHYNPEVLPPDVRKALINDLGR